MVVRLDNLPHLLHGHWNPTNTLRVFYEDPKTQVSFESTPVRTTRGCRDPGWGVDKDSLPVDRGKKEKTH